MNTLTGVDLPVGSPGGSVELLHDLYLGPAPHLPGGVFMLAPPDGPDAGPHSPATPGAPATPYGPALLSVPGKQLDGPGFWSYVTDLAAAIRRRFRAADHAVLHLQHLAFGATPALLRAFPDHPRLALVHGTDLLFAADHPTQADVLHQAVRAAQAIVVPTSAMADLLTRLAPADPRRVIRLPWGVPDELLTAPLKERRPDDGEFRVLYAGRLTAEKGADELIRSLAGAEGVRLTVAAPPAEFAALTRRMPGADPRYLGWLSRPELWEEFGNHDLLVVPSNRVEAFGLVAVEAQARGLPVLYQPVSGLVEVLGGSAARIGADGLPDTLVDSVLTLRKDPAALEDLRTAGLANARRHPLSATARHLRELSEAIQDGPHATAR
ncbi:glycosyltransferase family 4 protein [Streptomyces sp. MST-110588]|uniref:glycosyltransferase family 4 protein n=1 Tax=Streptomyces sp. MST-110588 TaxID=2833628 RepID=UPI001F5E3504|nr:glycosyltransferase family 4 protein [Streptomyces sp. MST-110588]UNO39179.1 glycosyltransferase family 4 protein [Streptomyces sp. MST-110588]